jgi:two-component system nitrogen regulation response regulator GlnG
MADQKGRSARALVVEDEDGVRFVLSRALEAAGLQVALAATLGEARAAVAQESFSCVFTDIRLPDGSGLDLVKELAGQLPRPTLVVMTAQDTVEHAIEAMKRGADEYLVKPFALADVQQVARGALERVRMQGPATREEPASAAFGLVGRSAAMREVYKRIGRAAPTDLPVLIEGESGTGKELVARALHESSRRAGGPFVAVNLAAVPAALVESELYGHERGAFTGASAARAGQFELAQGGTLLLDEIGELPLELQSKLLRALQEGEIARVGGRSSRVDVRVVAATNVDLARAMATGKFRADLYYRLRVLSLRLPPLRERREDVGILAEHFLRRDGPRLRGRTLTLSAGAKALLERHPWPGNVRELENVLRAAIVEASDGVLGAREVAAALGAPAEEAPGGWEGAWAAVVRSRLGTEGAHQRLLEDAERILLREALAKAAGNQVRAAASLGLHRNSLRRRMDELGLGAGPRREEEEP